MVGAAHCRDTSAVEWLPQRKGHKNHMADVAENFSTHEFFRSVSAAGVRGYAATDEGTDLLFGLHNTAQFLILNSV